MEKREIASSCLTETVYRTEDPALVLVSRSNTVEWNGKTAEFEGKGAACSRMTAHLFRLLETKGIKTAFREEITDTECLYRDTKEIPFAVVVRNYSAGAFAERTGVAEGTALETPTAEFRYLKEGLGQPMINGYDALALKLVSEAEIETVVKTAFRVNEALSAYFKTIGTDLIDLRLMFGRDKEELLLTGELSPDTMRLWDSGTHEKLDKDRFRRDLGNVGDAYLEMYRRLGIGEVKSILRKEA